MGALYCGFEGALGGRAFRFRFVSGVFLCPEGIGADLRDKGGFFQGPV